MAQVMQRNFDSYSVMHQNNHRIAFICFSFSKIVLQDGCGVVIRKAMSIYIVWDSGSDVPELLLLTFES